VPKPPGVWTEKFISYESTGLEVCVTVGPVLLFVMVPSMPAVYVSLRT
jgi:hypothetical protein